MLEPRSDSLFISSHPSAPDATAYSIVDGLALLDDDEVLGWGLEGVWEGSFGLFESGQSNNAELRN
jgi:hypothetical protein